jgi:hypothetical protein
VEEARAARGLPLQAVLLDGSLLRPILRIVHFGERVPVGVSVPEAIAAIDPPNGTAT